MKKFANVSGFYLALSVVAPIVLLPMLLLSMSGFFDGVFGSNIEVVTGCIIVLSVITLPSVGFYLKEKFKNENEQLQNIKKGLRYNIIFIIILLLISYSIFGAHLD
ncbi:MAG: hypothetical protein WCT49_05140 [Candidatus Paceibacterota bacterium]|jgi:uncharacterized membrane protein YdjX (TVP38/TMEM64 family)|nr:hypothetical protein [Candidatus Paceibacterota bacterium]